MKSAEDISYIFNKVLNNDPYRTPYIFVNIIEKDNKAYIPIEIPGFTRDQISVRFKDNCIKILAQRDDPIMGTCEFSKSFKYQGEYTPCRSLLRNGLLIIELERTSDNLQILTID